VAIGTSLRAGFREKVRAAIGQAERPEAAIAGDYLAALGWAGARYEGWRAQVRRRFPREASAFWALLDERGGSKDESDIEFYRLKNVSLAFSIEATLGYQGDFYRHFLRWFIAQHRTSGLAAPHSILDIGCDNGLLTCFFGLFFPDARVEGIDRCAEGIERAREVADLLGLGNVTFRRADVLTPAELVPAGSVDLAISALALRPALGPAHWDGAAPEARAWSAAEAMAGPASPLAVACLANIRGLLAPERGRLLTAERLLRTAELGRFVRDANAARFVVHWGQVGECSSGSPAATPPCLCWRWSRPRP
jgi:SAM-dependent methyltransferase